MTELSTDAGDEKSSAGENARPLPGVGWLRRRKGVETPWTYDPLPENTELQIAMLSQTQESYRSLNAQMWQVPIIGMTLIGGLWFGVLSTKAAGWPAILMLIFAGFAALGLIGVLQRVRSVMGAYTDWQAHHFPASRIDSNGSACLLRDRSVKRLFQAMLFLSAVLSAFMAYNLGNRMPNKYDDMTALAYYESRAAAVVARYDALRFEDVHPRLAALPPTADGARALDVGAGSGRDARWLAEQGFAVTAVEPSPRLLEIAQARSREVETIDWVQTALPFLSGLSTDSRYELILLSAVWMHIHPSERPLAIRTLAHLLDEDGLLYISLRLGQDDPERGIHAVSEAEVRRLAQAAGLSVCEVVNAEDLQGRSGVAWRSLLIRRSC